MASWWQEMTGVRVGAATQPATQLVFPGFGPFWGYFAWANLVFGNLLTLVTVHRHPGAASISACRLGVGDDRRGARSRLAGLSAIRDLERVLMGLAGSTACSFQRLARASDGAQLAHAIATGGGAAGRLHQRRS